MATAQVGIRVHRLLLALLLGVLLLFRQPLASRVLSNRGMVELSRVLVDSQELSPAKSLRLAENLLRQATVADESNRAAHRGLAWVYMLQGRYVEAAPHWQAAGMTTEDMGVWANQARRLSQPVGALHWYEQMALLTPGEESGALYSQYLILADYGEEESALAKLQEATATDRGWGSPRTALYAWHTWASHLSQQGEPQKAETGLATAVARYGEGAKTDWMLSSAYLLLGNLQVELGKPEQAVHSLEKAARSNEDSVWAHIDYGKVLYAYDRGRVAEVEREFAAAINVKPENAAVWSDLIRFWRNCGEAEKARSLCLQAQAAGLGSQLGEVCSSP